MRAPLKTAMASWAPSINIIIIIIIIKRTNISFRNTHFYSALRYSQLAASYLVQFLGTC